jgi:hypothetical protein
LGASGAAGAAGASGAAGGGGAPQATARSETDTAIDATRSLDMGKASEKRLCRGESPRHRQRRPVNSEQLTRTIKKKG